MSDITGTTETLGEGEIAALAAKGLMEDVPPRADGSYPDGTRLWLTERGRGVFHPMVDHARDLDGLEHPGEADDTADPGFQMDIDPVEEWLTSDAERA